MNIKIVFENQDFLILNKPPGILVHPVRSSAKGESLADELLNYCPDIKDVGEDSLRPGIVHRLDKDTSGLLIVAKNQETFYILKSLFKERTMEKIYRALVYGWLKQDEGKLESYIVRSQKSPQKRTSLPRIKEGLKGRMALTYYKTLQRLEDRKGNRYSLLELDPKTGRTHQLRTQLFSINSPIVGDPLYNIKSLPKTDIQRMFLHAEKLAFTFNKHYYQFISPIPKDLKIFLSNLKQCQIS